MDCSPPGSSVHGIPHARILEWVAIPFPRGSSQPRDWIHVSCIAGRFFTIWAAISVWSNLMLLNYGSGEDSWESLGLQGDQTSQYKRKSTLHIHWKDWCWSWGSNTLATWCKELTHWQRSWCWERLRAGGEEGSRGWDGWMASPTQWTWVWANFPGQGSLICCSPWRCKETDTTERTELNWTHWEQRDW